MGHQLMLYAFNKYQKDFIPASLYLRWQVTFQTLFITVKVMQVRDPTVSLYICQLGRSVLKWSQSMSGVALMPLAPIRMCQKNVLNVQNSLQAVPQLQYIKIAVVVQGAGDGKQVLGRLGPADCSVQSVDVKKFGKGVQHVPQPSLSNTHRLAHLRTMSWNLFTKAVQPF